ncbi:PEGA domain-containing protein [uncultured Lamprocystis sp.]|jgi:hypothetical protein|uniref:PEGA domain-containing protein n=1 Tax=uncultured Lamprocystis sp. TaxID=543132 RepID=UPI0025D8299E|nr:PEGA domain-containing protein [uncultured Lamprocystis sp.]
MTAAPSSTLAIAMTLAALTSVIPLVGCATRNLDCSSGARPSAIEPDPCRYIPAGASNELVEIGSSPTSAAIYVDGIYVGKTPIKHYLWFLSTTRAVTVVAVPLYPGQARQEQRLRVPPLPRRLTFFMNNPARTADPDAAAR